MTSAFYGTYTNVVLDTSINIQDQPPTSPIFKKIQSFWQIFQSQRIVQKLSLVFMLLILVVTPLIITQKTNIFSHAGISLITNCTQIPTGMTQDQIRQLSDSGRVRWCAEKASATSLPRAEGTFLLPNTPRSGISTLFDELQQLDMHTVVILRTREKYNGCSSNVYQWKTDMPDELGIILSEAQKRNIGVYIGLDITLFTCPSFYYDTNNLTQTAADTQITAQQITNSYGTYPSFLGWFIPDEPSIAYNTDPTYIATTKAYFKALVAAIRTVSSKPILISPYLSGAYKTNGATVATPAEVAARALDFQKTTGVDIQIWQDSLSMYATGLGWWARTPYTVQDYYKAIINALGSSHVWSDNELFNKGDPKIATDGQYHSASMVRLAQQFAMSSMVGKRLVNTEQEFLSTVDKFKVAETARLQAAYKAYFGLSSDSFITPLRYTWRSMPAVPDTTKMFDKKTGDPLSSVDVQWITIPKDAEIWIDLGSIQTVKWVAFHLLSNPPSILLPTALPMICSIDDKNWQYMGRFALPVSDGQGEYVFSNPSALALSCRYIKAQLLSGLAVHISEVEIVTSK